MHTGSRLWLHRSFVAQSTPILEGNVDGRLQPTEVEDLLTVTSGGLAPILPTRDAAMLPRAMDGVLLLTKTQCRAQSVRGSKTTGGAPEPGGRLCARDSAQWPARPRGDLLQAGKRQSAQGQSRLGAPADGHVPADQELQLETLAGGCLQAGQER